MTFSEAIEKCKLYEHYTGEDIYVNRATTKIIEIMPLPRNVSDRLSYLEAKGNGNIQSLYPEYLEMDYEIVAKVNSWGSIKYYEGSEIPLYPRP